jgi:hypothetical protein
VTNDNERTSLACFQNDPDHLVYLSLETLLDGFSILVFTPTKNWAEKLAETISKEVFVLGAPPPPSKSTLINDVHTVTVLIQD